MPLSLGYARTLILATLAVGAGGAAHAQSGAHVLLVANDRSAASKEIADYYARTRGVPAENLVRLAVDPGDEIDRALYELEIENPIASAIDRNAAHDRILYIVLTKGVPLRIRGTAGRQGTVASVDSELTLLYRKLTGRAVPVAGRVENPYFHENRPIAQAGRFTHRRHDIFLVSRLDGFTVADVIALIDRAARPGRAGRIVLDERAAPGDRAGDAWLAATAELLRETGWSDVVHDTTRDVVADTAGVVGYFAWGSNDPALTARRSKLSFAPGAIAGSFVSTDARTFDEPPNEWDIGSWDDSRTYFKGSPQSLTGDLVRDGATGVAGHVAEPYLDAAVRPQILFPAYLAGFNLVESFYLALPFLSWQTIVVGDPLCAPFLDAPLADGHIHDGVDPDTTWPVFFSARRLQTAAGDGGSNRSALSLAIRAEALLARKQTGEAKAALEQALKLDPGMVGALFALAALHEQIGELDAAVAGYRRVLARAPEHTAALNNLAYVLAVHLNTPREALPLAQRAYAAAKGNAAVADTLGWVHHLLEQHREAAGFLAEAVAAAPGDPAIRLHAAFVELALGRLDEARGHAKAAIDRRPALSSREDVVALLQLLREPSR